jgi:hypothetical protein
MERSGEAVKWNVPAWLIGMEACAGSYFSGERCVNRDMIRV